MEGNAPDLSTVTILFVDDEDNILRSLRRELADSEAEIFLAGSAEEGLKLLERERVDIVVSDYRMPVMNGIEFLGLVRKRYPGVYRVMLSGFMEQHIVLKALSSGVASVSIPKPWEGEKLQEEIRHLTRTRRLLKSPEILNVVNAIEDLPTLPDVYREFARAVEADSSCEELSRIISRDIATTTRILHVASSAYYRVDSKSLSLEKALMHIGINGIRDMLLFASLLEHGNRSSTQSEQLARIASHSFTVNCAIGELHRLKFGKPLPEAYGSVGLTHDIGKVIMLGSLPERFDAVIAQMHDQPDADFHQSELSLGFAGSTHVEIGAFFLDLWGLPEVSVTTSLYHHGSEACNASFLDILDLCRTAHLLDDYLEGSTDTEENELPSFLAGFEEQGIINLIAGLKQLEEGQGVS
ncbi:MAG TPA: HDOD domain-containing protein [Syntrophorhabdales bacterium]|nr:HDOD domain-containing protein [Syntrophorhabdales bacterium]